MTLQQHPLCLARLRIVTGDGSTLMNDAMLCMQQGRVTHVMPMDQAKPPAGARILELPGRTVLPGLVNAHMHDLHTPEARRAHCLLQGVTSLCDLAAPLEAVPLLRRVATPEGKAVPRTVTAGLVLTPGGGYPANFERGQSCVAFCDTPRQAANVVRLNHCWGARVVKLMFEPWRQDAPLPVLELDVARAAVGQARELDMPVRAHISEARGLSRALDAGVDACEHLPLRTSDGGPAIVEHKGRLVIAREIDDLLRRMVLRDVMLVPTLDAVTRGLWDNAPALTLVRRFHELGGRVALGNDSPFAQVPYGLPLRELELLHAAGLSRLECLQAAARHAALAAGLGGTGLLRRGFLADAVVVGNDPLQDFAALQQPELIILGGETVGKSSG